MENINFSRARKSLKPYVGDVEAAAVPCGLGRAIGNKVYDGIYVQTFKFLVVASIFEGCVLMYNYHNDMFLNMKNESWNKVISRVLARYSRIFSLYTPYKIKGFCGIYYVGK